MNTIHFTPLKKFLCIALISGALPLAAQVENRPVSYADDAGTFNKVTRGGTARSIGIGNATTALGGDMGVTTTNPAGLGFYRKSEINFTPVFGVSGGSSTYLGNTNGESKGYFAINNMGGVINLPSANDKGYKGGSLSFGMNRVNNFHNKISFVGVNAKNNIGDHFTQNALGIHETELLNNSTNQYIPDLATLTYAAWVIFPYNPNTAKDTIYHTLYEKKTVQQSGIVTNKGAQYNWYAAYGGNISDKFYFGFSFNLATIKREQNFAFNETAGVMSNGQFKPVYDTLIDMTYYNNLKTTGTGVSFAGGIVWKPSKGIRMGASITSPTFYTMKDAQTQQIDVNYKAYPLISLQDHYNISTNETLYKYSYRSPLHASGGIAMFVGKKGFITGDVEVIPYADSKYSAKDKTVNQFQFADDNKTIKNNYRTTINFRGGAEFRANSVLFRGGFAYLGDPNKSEDKQKNNLMQFSLGFGIRGETQYIDFALVNTRSVGTYQPYTLKNGSQPTADIKYTNYGLVVSGGLYF